MNQNIETIQINQNLSAVIDYNTENDVSIKIKYLDCEVPHIEKIVVGDWIDLYAAETVIIPKNTMALVNLGVAMQLPFGYEAHLLPRSSTFKHWGCIQTNSCGIIDESYRGDNDYWKIPLYCLQPNQGNILYINNDESAVFEFLAKHKFGDWILRHFFYNEYEKHQFTIIKKGEKIAQFRIMKHMPTIRFNEVEFLNNADRGGFGSTGKG